MGSDNNELFEVIKNGPLKQGECLLTINGQTFRIFIRNLNFEMDYGNGIPEFTLNGITFDDAAEMYKALIQSGEK